jgi:hypothetical protein
MSYERERERSRRVAPGEPDERRQEIVRFNRRAALTQVRGQASGGLRRNATVVAAMLTGVSAIVAAIIGVGGVLSSDNDPVKDDCAVVFDHYKDLAQGEPDVARVLAGRRADGSRIGSVVASDPAAVQCKITEDTLIEMSRLPK